MHQPLTQHRPCASTLAITAAMAIAAAAPGLALAQYKVVNPDGSVTYTDRPPVNAASKITQVGHGSGSAGPEENLPPALRGPAQRYPVTLYAASDCPPCDNGRRFLQDRGIPYAERRIGSEADALALERLVGGRTLPALTIGKQPLRGFASTDWTSYLDAAGYPKTSKLPRDWPAPTPRPLTEPPEAAAARAAKAATAAPPPPPPLPASGSLQF